jgi:riboflavin biosynthesis pyrimidine reductase
VIGCDAATVRQLLPPARKRLDIDPSVYRDDPRPAPPDRPWVIVNMISTADGATAVADQSGPIGGPADKAVFHTIRSVADYILVGAGTARAENYGPVRRKPDGRPGARIAIVTRTGNIDRESPLFDDGEGPLIVTCEACPIGKRAALAEIAELVIAGGASVDPTIAMTFLATKGAGVVLCEGGPSLNGDLLAADVVDEWCLTIAPMAAAGRSKRVAVGPDLPDGGTAAFRLARLLESDGYLFARYLRDRS